MLKKEITSKISFIKNNKDILIQLQSFGYKNNIPDDFYHIRHDTLICSNSKELARKRINMLTSFYKSKEGFTDGCIGKRDGVSGCRNCCSKKYSNNYGDFSHFIQ